MNCAIVVFLLIFPVTISCKESDSRTMPVFFYYNAIPYNSGVTNELLMLPFIGLR